MPLQQGEVSLLTLFTDVHTYLAPPTARPVHHRFDRRSYLYLFHDALNKRGRIEVANNAGTPEQDAFNGYLDAARIEYSYKQPNLFTITVDSRGHGSPQNDISQWHLPSYDPRNENKYMYKVHTLDLYLWTPEDANLLVDSLKRVLHPGQLVLSHVPEALHSEHRNSMSPVVQQLENAAISHHPHRTASVSTSQSFPPPPPSQHSNATPTSPPQTQQTFAPVAYNPAAPAAPEQRLHREKTPPPPDADAGTGLNGAAQHEQPGYYGQPPQGGFAPQSAPYMPGPPGAQPGMNRTSTVASIGSMPPPPSSASPYQTSFAGPPQQAATTQHDPNAHLYAQQPGTPGLQRQSTYPYQSGQPATPATQAPQPTTQYANYPSAVPNAQGPASPPPTQQSYAPLQSPGYAPQQTTPSPYGQQTQAQPAAQGQQGYGTYNPASTTHAMHTQFYTPEGSSTPAIPGQGSHGGNGKVDPGRLDATVGRLEKRVGGFLKRLDKKL